MLRASRGQRLESWSVTASGAKKMLWHWRLMPKRLHGMGCRWPNIGVFDHTFAAVRFSRHLACFDHFPCFGDEFLENDQRNIGGKRFNAEIAHGIPIGDPSDENSFFPSDAISLLANSKQVKRSKPANKVLKKLGVILVATVQHPHGIRLLLSQRGQPSRRARYRFTLAVT
jgi:hypothetical protein